jgi:hypothetical protein
MKNFPVDISVKVPVASALKAHFTTPVRSHVSKYCLVCINAKENVVNPASNVPENVSINAVKLFAIKNAAINVLLVRITAIMNVNIQSVRGDAAINAIGNHAIKVAKRFCPVDANVSGYVAKLARNYVKYNFIRLIIIHISKLCSVTKNKKMLNFTN